MLYLTHTFKTMCWNIRTIENSKSSELVNLSAEDHLKKSNLRDLISLNIAKEEAWDHLFLSLPIGPIYIMLGLRKMPLYIMG